MNKIVLGIDPGYAIVGFSIIQYEDKTNFFKKQKLGVSESLEKKKDFYKSKKIDFENNIIDNKGTINRSNKDIKNNKDNIINKNNIWNKNNINNKQFFYNNKVKKSKKKLYDGKVINENIDSCDNITENNMTINIKKGVNDDIKLISYGVITTGKDINYFDRIKEICFNIEYLIEKYSPDYLAIEKLYYFKNKKTIMHVSEVRGAIILLALQKNISIYEYTPLQIKMAITSYGRASKIQIQNMITKVFNLDKIPKPDDAADAIACGLTHIWSINNVLGN